MCLSSIQKLEGIDKLANLSTLDVAQNEIKALENIRQLSQLEEFLCNNNQISNWVDLKRLTSLKLLEAVYLGNNPL